MLELMLTTGNSSKVTFNKLAIPAGIKYGSGFGMCVDYTNGNIYCCGGQLTDNTYNRTLYRYNITADTWTTLAALPEAPDRYAVMECIGTMIYYNCGSITYSYNITTNSWVKMTPPTYGTVYWQTQADSFVRNGLIYRVGRDSNNTPPEIITSWNVTNNTYATVYRSETGALWISPRCVLNNDIIYIFGIQPFTQILRYSFTQGLLSPINIPEGVSIGPAGFAFTKGEWLYFNRGNSKPAGADTYLTDFWRYNVTTAQFERLPNLPQPSYNGGADLVGNKLYLYAGSTGKSDNSVLTDFYSVNLPDD